LVNNLLERFQDLNPLTDATREKFSFPNDWESNHHEDIIIKSKKRIGKLELRA
jgi:hypothetical protein